MVIPWFWSLSQTLYIIGENCNLVVGARKLEFPNSSLLAVMVTRLQTNELIRKGSLLIIITYMTLWKKKS